MKKYLPYLKNKFILAGTIFFIYTLFLDNNDIFTILSQKLKLKELNEKRIEMVVNLENASNTLGKLKYKSEVEKYAREKKLFKRENEDVFVIFYE
ncbi:MAG: hypothetical protein KC454_11085 [Flavobacteriales bacterium]|nr:hypothetical protein [Flavobacteriales bacterium]